MVGGPIAGRSDRAGCSQASSLQAVCVNERGGYEPDGRSQRGEWGRETGESSLPLPKFKVNLRPGVDLDREHGGDDSQELEGAAAQQSRMSRTRRYRVAVATGVYSDTILAKAPSFSAWFKSCSRASRQSSSH